MLSLPWSSFSAVESISSYVAPKSDMVPYLPHIPVHGPSGPFEKHSRVQSRIPQWGALPTCPDGGCGDTLLFSLARGRLFVLVDVRHLHRHSLAGLHEDAASHREVGALDSSEGNLEQSVAVVGVGLQGDALTSRFPRPEHAGSATSAAHVGLAKEDVVAVVQRLQQPAEGTVGRA